MYLQTCILVPSSNISIYNYVYNKCSMIFYIFTYIHKLHKDFELCGIYFSNYDIFMGRLFIIKSQEDLFWKETTAVGIYIIKLIAYQTQNI